jgi:hypothetical protein
MIPLRTVIRLAENGLVSIRANLSNGLITARITERGRFVLKQMRCKLQLSGAAPPARASFNSREVGGSKL